MKENQEGLQVSCTSYLNTFSTLLTVIEILKFVALDKKLIYYSDEF